MSPLGFLGSKADITMNLDRHTVQAGEELEVRVEIFPKKSFQVREARIELVRLLRYVDKHTTGSSSGSGSRRTEYRALTRRTSVVQEAFLHGAQLQQKSPLSEAVKLAVPPDTLPTLTGAVSHGVQPGISWQVKAVLDVAKARDPSKKQDIVVVKPPSLEAPPPVPAVAESQRRKCALVLSTASTDVRSHGAVEGTLQVHMLKDANVDGVVVRLVRVEEFGDAREAVEVRKLTLEHNPALPAGNMREWPFRLDVGQVDVPTLRAYRSSVAWSVEGRLDLKMRRDPVVRQPLNVDV